MKVLSKGTILLFISLSVISLSSCNKSNKFYSEIKNPTSYLHEITYEDYEEDSNCESLNYRVDSYSGCLDHTSFFSL